MSAYSATVDPSSEPTGRGGVLQGALATGLSATEGYHTGKNTPTPVDSSFDGSKAILPETFVPKSDTRVKLRAKNGDVEASWLSIGSWSWGDKATWHWDESERAGLTEAWKVLADGGINYIDTAQAYGSGESERITGELIKGMDRSKLVIQTKWYVVPDNLKNITSPTASVESFLHGSLERMGIEYVDVYMVHGHIHIGSIKQVAKGLADCVEKGLTKAVAVANYSTEDMIQMHDELAKYDIPLALNQCEFNLLRRIPEVSGLIAACQERGIQYQSYSSLAQGRLTGKWTAEKEPPSTYRFSSYPIKEIEHTLAAVKQIADKRGVSMAAVALNYNIGKDVLPVVGVRNVAQAKSNLEALGWRLTKDEYAELDKVSVLGAHSKLWQQG